MGAQGGRAWVRAAVTGVCTLAVAGFGVTAVASASAARAVGGAGTAGLRTVSYGGVHVRVPTTWPVYDLSAEPTRCLLWSVDAVYLGVPGPDEHCPASAVGRSDAVWLRTAPAATQAAATPAEMSPEEAWTVRAGSTLLTITYGRSATAARQILDTARYSGPSSPRLVPSPAAQVPPKGTAGPVAGAAGRGYARSVPGDLLGAQVEQGRGFDACTVPPVSTMRAWLASPYRVIGTYLGGVNWACTYGDFTPQWVRQVAAMGWSYIPIYVGLQASCSTIPGAALIDPADAAAEGLAAADDAASLATTYGYGPASPIYFDMEGYDSADPTCNDGVLDFLSAWTSGLHRLGYRSGVYSSAGSGIAALAAASGTPGFVPPDDIWIGDWDGASGTSDPYVPAGDWHGQDRIHQFYGGHNETWGGQTVNVDDDTVDGLVAAPPEGWNPGSSWPATARNAAEPGREAPGRARPVDVATGGVALTPSAVTVAPGGTATTSLRVSGPAQQPGFGLAAWRADAAPGISVSPAAGVVAAGRLAGMGGTRVRVSVGPGVATGRYEIPVTGAAEGRPVAETFLVVTVAPAGRAVPTPAPLRLYAATPADLAVATHLAEGLDLPGGDVVASFEQAWSDLTSGSDLVLAVGAAADNALQTNPCGWADPAGEAAGSTPFLYLGDLDEQPPGADVYENSAGAGPAGTAGLTDLLATYALTGLSPNLGPHELGAAAPTTACLGSPDPALP